ncbi:MAG TPA: hypothetical protein VFE94_03880 [Candidatus Paceibacterota bacterium]|nr:hypothetical protein [Candidatus Paceibacterota bacterium]
MSIETVALPSGVIEALKEMFAFFVNHPVDSPQTRTKVVEFCQIVLQNGVSMEEASEESFASVLLEGFGETWDVLVSRLPYLSEDQKNALQNDMGNLFETWEKCSLYTRKEIDGAAKKIHEEVIDVRRHFGLDSIPVDVVPEKTLEVFVHDLLDDTFGGLLKNLPLVERTRKELMIQEKIRAFY